jgi:hypothetical protein
MRSAASEKTDSIRADRLSAAAGELKNLLIPKLRNRKICGASLPNNKNAHHQSTGRINKLSQQPKEALAHRLYFVKTRSTTTFAAHYKAR